MNKKIFKKMSICLCLCLPLSFSTFTQTNVKATTDSMKQQIKLAEKQMDKVKKSAQNLQSISAYLYKLEKDSVSFTAQLKDSYVTSNTGKPIGKVKNTLIVYDKKNDDLYMKTDSGKKTSIEVLQRKIHSKECITYQLSQDGQQWQKAKAASTIRKYPAQISAELSLFNKLLNKGPVELDKTNKSLLFTVGQFKSYRYTVAGNKLTRVAETALDTGETNIKTNIYSIGNTSKIDYKNLKK